MYGRIKEQKLRTNNIAFSVEQVKNELECYIDDENKRVNIDSAKKRAVLQGMDYDGFRQMVLGAHLFVIKSKELIDMSADRTNKKNEIVLNSSLTTFNNVVDLSMRQKEEIELINLRIAQMLANNELQSNNFREFKKNFDSQYKEPIDDVAAQNIYLILKSQKEENFKKIFSLDFDVSYFVKLLRVMKYIIEKSLLPNSNSVELLFLLKFMDCKFDMLSSQIFKIYFQEYFQSFYQELLELMKDIQDFLQEHILINIQMEFAKYSYFMKIFFIQEMNSVKDFQFSVPKFLSGKEKVELKEFMEFLKLSVSDIFTKRNEEQVEQAEGESGQKEEKKEESSENQTNPTEEKQVEEQEKSESTENNQKVKEEEETIEEKQDQEEQQIALQEVLKKLESYYIR